MWAIIVVLQLMLPRDSLSSIVSLLSLQGAFTLLLANSPVIFYWGRHVKSSELKNTPK